jgi:hypothetical protein
MYCAGSRSQSCDIVLIEGGALTWEGYKGSGFLNEKQMGNRWGGMGMRRSVYEQPGTRVDGYYRSREGSK